MFRYMDYREFSISASISEKQRYRISIKWLIA
jgi:hypothetical protein